MFEAQEINAEHKDLIHDVAYDYYGDRMATCSSDQYVKVWDKTKEGKWTLTSSWKAHSASVWKVTWAHPEFGQVLATCSFDRTAAVWEEIVGDTPGPGKRGTRHWVRRTNLVDSRTSVTDVKFGPKSQGLQLATCSAEGIIRIYEAPDVMNLSQWTLQHEVQCKLPLSCLDWNPSLSRLHPPMIAVGSDETGAGAGGKVFIYEYSENSRKWIKLDTVNTITDPVHDIAFAPNLGRSFHILGVATKDVRIVNLTPVDDEQSAQSGLTKLDIQTAAQFDDHGCTVWRVCWNVTGTILASSGDDGCVRMFKMHGIKLWKATATLKGDGTQIPTAAEAARSTSQNIPQGTPVSTIASQTARYIKLGSISQPSREPWCWDTITDPFLKPLVSVVSVSPEKETEPQDNGTHEVVKSITAAVASVVVTPAIAPVVAPVIARTKTRVETLTAIQSSDSISSAQEVDTAGSSQSQEVEERMQLPHSTTEDESEKPSEM